MTDQKTLDRIQALLSRAADKASPEEEARTSAVIACRMIVEHKLKLVDENQTASEPVSGGEGVGFNFVNLDPEAAETLKRVVDMGLDVAFQTWQENVVKRKKAEERSQPRSYATGNAFDARAHGRGTCKSCGKPYAHGERVRARRDTQYLIHYTCEWPDDLGGQAEKK